MLAAAKTRLDKAVGSGRITAAQEQQRLANLPAQLDRVINRTPLAAANMHARRG